MTATSPSGDPIAAPAQSRAEAESRFEQRLASMAASERDRRARRDMWLAHHWPAHYGERCVRVGRRHVCRRCAALYPVGLVVAILSAAGYPPCLLYTSDAADE